MQAGERLEEVVEATIVADTGVEGTSAVDILLEEVVTAADTEAVVEEATLPTSDTTLLLILSYG